MLEYLLASTLYTGEESLPLSRNRVCRAPGAARRVFLDILVTSRQNHGRQAKRLGPDSSTGAGAGSGVAGGGHLEKKKKPEKLNSHLGGRGTDRYPLAVEVRVRVCGACGASAGAAGAAGAAAAHRRRQPTPTRTLWQPQPQSPHGSWSPGALEPALEHAGRAGLGWARPGIRDGTLGWGGGWPPASERATDGALGASWLARAGCESANWRPPRPGTA